MAKWLCKVCGYIYDEEVGDEDSGLKAGTKWEDVPEDWGCPVCGAKKGSIDDWEKLEESKN